MITKRKFGRFEDEIFVEEVPISEIADLYGTPTYIYSANRIRANFNRLKDAMKVFQSSKIFYAIKACNNPHIAKILIEMGCGIDAASPNEILLALRLGVKPDNIIFTGNNLYDEDIAFALESGVHFNVDDHGMLDHLLMIGVPKSICFRVNVGSENSGGVLDFSGPQSKFGILPDHISECVDKSKSKGVKKISLHMMPGSCQLDVGYFAENARRLADLAVEISEQHKINLNFIDLGGGLGIPYSSSEAPLDVKKVCSEVNQIFCEKFSEHKLDIPEIVMEPARYLVGDAAILVGRVNAVKNSTQVIIGTDLSMNVMARGILYDAHHRFEINRKNTEDRVDAGYCGQVCENTDFHRKSEQFPSTVETGDLMLLYDVGAYGYSMAYDYNGRVTPTEVLVDADKYILIRRRKTFSDTLSLVENVDFLQESPNNIKSFCSTRGDLT